MGKIEIDSAADLSISERGTLHISGPAYPPVVVPADLLAPLIADAIARGVLRLPTPPSPMIPPWSTGTEGGIGIKPGERRPVEGEVKPDNMIERGRPEFGYPLVALSVKPGSETVVEGGAGSTGSVRTVAPVPEGAATGGWCDACQASGGKHWSWCPYGEAEAARTRATLALRDAYRAGADDATIRVLVAALADAMEGA